MCWSQQLFDAMIHVYNRGLHDYTTPLLELLLQLREIVRKGKAVPGSLVHVKCRRLKCQTPIFNSIPPKRLE